MEAILEEELEVDNFKGPEPVGCWESFIKVVWVYVWKGLRRFWKILEKVWYSLGSILQGLVVYLVLRCLWI